MLKYFISKEFFITLLGLGLLGLLAYLLIFFIFLPSYTRHGEALLVPDVYELPWEEAQNILKQKGLRVEVRDSAYYDDLEPLTVVSQYPVALSRVKPNRKVYLTLNKRVPPMVKVPDIEGFTLYQAKSRLESWKLGIGTVSTRPDLADNVVLEYSYKGRRLSPGQEVPQGAQINVVIGSNYGSGRSTEIPNLIGLTYEEAVNTLRQYHLGVGSVIYNPNGPPEEEGKVYNQNPRALPGDSLQVGQSVNLFIYGKEPEQLEGVEIEVIKNN